MERAKRICMVVMHHSHIQKAKDENTLVERGLNGQAVARFGCVLAVRVAFLTVTVTLSRCVCCNIG